MLLKLKYTIMLLLEAQLQGVEMMAMVRSTVQVFVTFLLMHPPQLARSGEFGKLSFYVRIKRK